MDIKLDLINKTSTTKYTHENLTYKPYTEREYLQKKIKVNFNLIDRLGVLKLFYKNSFKVLKSIILFYLPED